jgi:diketogulonate reductase-like aldo/keto reductase
MPMCSSEQTLQLTSKLWNSFHKPEHVQMGIKETLKNLGTDYLDLYLMHWCVLYLREDCLIRTGRSRSNSKALASRPTSRRTARASSKWTSS